MRPAVRMAGAVVLIGCCLALTSSPSSAGGPSSPPAETSENFVLLPPPGGVTAEIAEALQAGADPLTLGFTLAEEAPAATGPLPTYNTDSSDIEVGGR